MHAFLKPRLGAMMFLEFFIWGGWFVTMGTYLATTLGAGGAEIGSAYSTQSWGAIVAPFVFGIVADRFLSAERLLGVIHLAGAVLLLGLSRAPSFGDFHPLLLGYMILYMPTLALVNAIALRALPEPQVQFSRVRLWGTVGWIVAGLAISYVFLWDAPGAIQSGLLGRTFLMGAAASLVLGVYSFTLPRTPPLGGGRGSLAQAFGADALGLLRDRNFLVFFVASILVCIPLAFYYQHANQFLTEIGVTSAAGKQTLGQASEVLFMLAVPYLLARLGAKGTLLLGMAAWAARYLLFALGDSGGLAWVLLLGIALHGACYDFFFVVGQVYTDSKAGERCRSSAQGLITLATYGLGMLIGFHVAGLVVDRYVLAGGHDWRAVWLVPAAIAAAILVAFAIAFRGAPVRRQGG